MHTIITKRGQVSIPAALRKKFKLSPGSSVEWIETVEGIFLIPVPKDPIDNFRGKAKGLSTHALLQSRSRDYRKEKP